MGADAEGFGLGLSFGVLVTVGIAYGLLLLSDS
jgi:hypothetical protein